MPLSSKQAVDYLGQALKNGRLAHAYILSGTVDAIEREVLEPLMRELLDVEELAEHPDVHCIRPASKSRQILREDIEQVMGVLSQKSYIAGGKKIAVILHADRMNATVSNKFLKTLEEPHERTHIFLLTERPTALLTTIRSRCGILSLRPQEPELEEEAQELVDVASAGPFAGQLAALLWCHELEGYFAGLRSRTEKEQKALAKDLLRQYEGEAREEKEKELAAQSASAYQERRAVVMGRLSSALGAGRPDAVASVEKAYRDMQKNVQEPVILERMALGLVG